MYDAPSTTTATTAATVKQLHQLMIHFTRFSCFFFFSLSLSHFSFSYTVSITTWLTFFFLSFFLLCCLIILLVFVSLISTLLCKTRCFFHESSCLVAFVIARKQKLAPIHLSSSFSLSLHTILPIFSLSFSVPNDMYH